MTGQLEVSLPQTVAAALAGNAVAALWRFLHLRRCRWCAFHSVPYDNQRTVPWYARLIESVLVCGVIAVGFLRPSFSFSYVILVAVLGIRLVRLCRATMTERLQFT